MPETRDTATREQLEAALAKLLEGQTGTCASRISISAVAREAGFTPALIHNRYPDLAARIRVHMGRDVHHRPDEQAELQALRDVVQELRQRIGRLEADLARIASINAALSVDNAELRAMLKSGNVVSLPKHPSSHRL
ncbi:AcrR family transcriptional regulator [Paraburkholderia sp. GAS448]|jgi:AcrR family transcriptional regulator|uniref:TetR family transcriptional regulator n=1 Tax=Paraburkholderia sp. GAS448 TaxID=3035136 RepID=UPI003D1ADC35